MVDGFRVLCVHIKGWVWGLVCTHKGMGLGFRV
jgi:hypothetical protein